MRQLSCLIAPLCLVVGATSLSGQQAPRFSGQAVIGVAHRTNSGFSTAEVDGLHLLTRLGYRVTPHLQVVGEASLAKFGSPAIAYPTYCPVSAPCPIGIGSSSSLGVAGFSIGLQPHVEAGPLRLMAGASIGGYWLYHHDPGMPGGAPGVRATVGLGLPIGGRLHVLLEGSQTRLLGNDVSEANTRNVAVGVAIN